MSLIRVLHVTLPEDLATHVPVSESHVLADAQTSSSSSLPNRCLVIDVDRHTATPSQWVEESGAEEGEDEPTTTQTSPRDNAAPTGSVKALVYDDLLIHPHNAALFENRITPALDELCAYVVGTRRGSDQDPPSKSPLCRTVVLYGHDDDDDVDNSDSGNHTRADLFADTIWRASQHLLQCESSQAAVRRRHMVREEGSANTSPEAEPEVESGAAPFSVWLSLADMYPRWGVGDVLDERHAMHKADRYHRQPQSSFSSLSAHLHLTMAPIRTTLPTPQAWQACLRAADAPGSLRTASLALQRDHRHRSVLVASLSVISATPSKANPSRWGCLHVILLPKARLAGSPSSMTAVEPTTRTAASNTSRELSAFSEGLSLLTLDVPARILSSPLAATAQRALKDSATWRFLDSFQRSTVTSRSSTTCLIVSSASATSESVRAWTINRVRCAIGSAPILVVCVRSAWRHYAQVRSAFLFARRATTVPARWWRSSRSSPSERTMKKKIACEDGVREMEPCALLETPPHNHSSEDVVSLEEGENSDTQVLVLSLGTSSPGEASPSHLTPNTSLPIPYPYAPSPEGRADDDDVRSVAEPARPGQPARPPLSEEAAHGTQSSSSSPRSSSLSSTPHLTLLAQKDALIVSLRAEVELLREENKRLRRRDRAGKQTRALDVDSSQTPTASYHCVSDPAHVENTHDPSTAWHASVNRLVALAHDLFLRPGRGRGDDSGASSPHRPGGTGGDDQGGSQYDAMLLGEQPRSAPSRLCWRCRASLSARSNERFYGEFIPLVRALIATEGARGASLSSQATPQRLPLQRGVGGEAPLVESHGTQNALPHARPDREGDASVARQQEVQHLRAQLAEYESLFALWHSQLGPQLELDLHHLDERQYQHQQRERQFHVAHADTVQDMDRILHSLRRRGKE